MENSYDKRGRPGVINYRLSLKGQKLEGAVRKSKKEEAERRRREQQRIFVEGLQRYKSKGIQILIDGRECRPEEYRKLCEFREDGSFYMADYVGAETGVLTEIHFDRVYNR